MLTVDPRHRATIDDIAEHEWIVAGQNSENGLECRTPEALSFSEYLESSLEQCGSDSDLNTTLKAVDNESTQPKSILKHKIGSGDESPPPPQPNMSEKDENVAGKLDTACGLHAKDSLKLKAKPYSASGKRRVLRSRRDRESGYYSSPERPNANRDSTSTSSDAKNRNCNVPQIKSALTGGRATKLGVKSSSVPSKSSGFQGNAKECYLVPINPGPDERLPSLSSDDGCSIRSQSRPASTYSDSSILSSDSFDLCTFEGAGPGRKDSVNSVLPSTTPKRPLSDNYEAGAYISTLETPSGSLTPKSERLVRDLQRILGSSGRRAQNKAADRTPERRPRSLDENTNISNMVNQLNVELDLAYKKGCANLRSAEV